MRAVVTRVSEASVTVDGEVGRGDRGGAAGTGRRRPGRRRRPGAGAGEEIHELRIFPTDDGARSAADLGLPVLVVSQFTLYADTRKGRRPSWQDAAPGEEAEPLVDEVVAELRRRGCDGGDRASSAPRMQVASVNEGPMTLQLEI